MVKTVIISDVENGSPADIAGLLPDDILLTINGGEINDVLDYRFYLAERHIRLLVRRADRELTFDIRKDEYGDIGLIFDTPLMDKKRRCSNACVFCFIDQNPPGMRETIYFKDDDSRLSFLHGNYITMTNLSDRDVDRIVKMHISPVRVSVHTTDPELRCKMMKNPHAGDSLAYLRRFADAGLEINAQIVLCRGINDGTALDRTMQDLAAYIPRLTSVSVVPAGLTRHRDGLYPLSPFTPDEAAQVIRQVNSAGDRCRQRHGSRVFFCADEFYLKAGITVPDCTYYEDYSQLENGVGMLRTFEDDFNSELEYLSDSVQPVGRTVSVATGEASYEMLSRLTAKAEKLGIRVRLYKIVNEFYGHGVTVSGLLTGGDILSQLNGKPLGSELLIPANALRRDEDDFLDGMTRTELSEKLGVKVTPSGEDGAEFLHALLGG